MRIAVDVHNIDYWYRDSTRTWCVRLHYSTNNTSVVVTFSNKRLNKAKKNMVKYLCSGFCGDEIIYLIKSNQIKIEELTQV